MRLMRRALMGAVAAALACGLTTVPARADVPSPSPTTSPTTAAQPPRTAAEVRVEVDRLREEQQRIEGRAAEIEKRLSDTSDRIDEKQGDIADAEAVIAQAKTRLAAVALNQYQDHDSASTAALMLSAGDTESFLDALSAADNVADNNSSLLVDFEAQQASLTDDRRALEAEKAAARADYEELQRLRADAQAKVEAARRQVDQLDAAEREAYYRAEAERIALEEAQRRAAEAANRAAADEDAADGTEPSGAVNPAPAPSVAFTGYNGYAFGNCTYYAYARRQQLNRPVANGWHHAKMWPDAARRAGLTVDTTPEVGALYVTFRGYYGHVMVVEQVNDDGSFLVSEMNYHGGPGTGFNRISTRTVGSVAGVFIH